MGRIQPYRPNASSFRPTQAASFVSLIDRLNQRDSILYASIDGRKNSERNKSERQVLWDGITMCEMEMGTPPEIEEYVNFRLANIDKKWESDGGVADGSKLELRRSERQRLTIHPKEEPSTMDYHGGVHGEAPMTYEELRIELEDALQQFEDEYKAESKTKGFLAIKKVFEAGLSTARIPQGQSAEDIWQRVEEKVHDLVKKGFRSRSVKEDTAVLEATCQPLTRSVTRATDTRMSLPGLGRASTSGLESRRNSVTIPFGFDDILPISASTSSAKQTHDITPLPSPVRKRIRTVSTPPPTLDYDVDPPETPSPPRSRHFDSIPRVDTMSSMALQFYSQVVNQTLEQVGHYLHTPETQDVLNAYRMHVDKEITKAKVKLELGNL